MLRLNLEAAGVRGVVVLSICIPVGMLIYAAITRALPPEALQDLFRLLSPRIQRSRLANWLMLPCVSTHLSVHSHVKLDWEIMSARSQTLLSSAGARRGQAHKEYESEILKSDSTNRTGRCRIKKHGAPAVEDACNAAEMTLL